MKGKVTTPQIQYLEVVIRKSALEVGKAIELFTAIEKDPENFSVIEVMVQTLKVAVCSAEASKEMLALITLQAQAQVESRVVVPGGGFGGRGQ